MNWLHTYVTNRYQHVVINDEVSNQRVIRQGVPQGSVMGPILFTLYSSPLETILQSYGFGYVVYADDTQLYTLKHSDLPLVIPQLESCLVDIKLWSS